MEVVIFESRVNNHITKKGIRDQGQPPSTPKKKEERETSWIHRIAILFLGGGGGRGGRVEHEM